MAEPGCGNEGKGLRWWEAHLLLCIAPFSHCPCNSWIPYTPTGKARRGLVNKQIQIGVLGNCIWPSGPGEKILLHWPAVLWNKTQTSVNHFMVYNTKLASQGNKCPCLFWLSISSICPETHSWNLWGPLGGPLGRPRSCFWLSKRNEAWSHRQPLASENKR